MSIRIEETFQLRAPIDRVWSYLVDPRQVVGCLPGAELTSVVDEATFLGKVKVKVGPVTAAYDGKVVITERDEGAHVVRLVGEGREATGSGSAKMTMTSVLASLADGGTEVRVTADLDVVGKLAQFGRGMIESVNKQMFRQFTDCVRATLEAAAPGEATAEPGAPPAVVATEAVPAPAPTAPPTPPTPPVQPAPAGAEPVRLLPVLLRAIWENLVAALRALWRLVAGGRRPAA